VTSHLRLGTRLRKRRCVRSGVPPGGQISVFQQALEPTIRGGPAKSLLSATLSPTKGLANAVGEQARSIRAVLEASEMKQ
jgi:hypothetical protein